VKWGPLDHADLLDEEALARVFRDHAIDAVMHFAARSQVGESMEDPGLYFRNNVTGTLNLLDAMRAAGVGKLVFSSTAAVYGNPQYTPIDEAHPTRPINTYGWTKLMAERQIEEYCHAYAMSAVSLRYFNAAGADADGEIGEAHEPETHLIPNVIRAAIDPSRGPVKLFGDDYETPDGTCIRDYIHVEDLCDAHLRALDHVDRARGFRVFNLGSGRGSSVVEVLLSCRSECAGAPASVTVPRRKGDPAVLVASHAAATSVLEWHPLRTLADCVMTAAAWHIAEAKNPGDGAAQTVDKY